MNLMEAALGVAEVRRLAGADDRECAHSAEDKLHQAALRTIAAESTDSDARALAALVLQTTEIDYGRWYA